VSLASPFGALIGRRPDATAKNAAALVISEGRPPDRVAFESTVVCFFVEAADALGVPKSIGAIYAICFASAQPLSFGDISSRLNISQGSISQGLRVLKEMGALKVVGTHERRDYFAPELELRKLAARFIEDRVEKQLDIGNQRLKAMQAAIPDGPKTEAHELEARLKYLETWRSKGRSIIPIIKTFLKLT
jgi:DNA-binding transcriptional regulator GbsR (MarR family)